MPSGVASLQADRVMKRFQSGFVGKASPVQFFWGSFDLAAARYSGRLAPTHPGGAPNCPDWVMVEAYSREESSHGWWPASESPGPAFYAYTYPEPNGFRSAPVRPGAASYDPRLGEFILPYDAVRDLADPDAAVLEFLQSTYEAGAELAGWDRRALEPENPPANPSGSAVERRQPGRAPRERPGSNGSGLGRSVPPTPRSPVTSRSSVKPIISGRPATSI